MFHKIPSLIDVNVLAKAWRKSPWSIYRMAREGQIPSVRIGRSVMFDPDAIVRHIKNQNRRDGDGDDRTAA